MSSVADGEMVRVDEGVVRSHVDEVVRSSVEETLNGLLDAEADHLCGAKRYERSAERVDTRAGSYDRKLQAKAGEVKLKVPRLRSLPFESQIIERYRLATSIGSPIDSAKSAIQPACNPISITTRSGAASPKRSWNSPGVVGMVRNEYSPSDVLNKQATLLNLPKSIAMIQFLWFGEETFPHPLM